ncbi:MAG TPA: hypothetical protein VLE73_00360 [Candidatus Saccharimonadales bacterium]|nr:hypothetical protein [Candidatus Saccharimonadales bacterium]
MELINLNIEPNLAFPRGAQLQQYASKAYALAIQALRPRNEQTIIISPPDGYYFEKIVQEHDMFYFHAPDAMLQGTPTDCSAGERLRSEMLWTPANDTKATNADYSLICDMPLDSLSDSHDISKLPANTWAGVSISERSLTQGLVHVVRNRSRKPGKEFNAAPYLKRLLQ